MKKIYTKYIMPTEEEYLQQTIELYDASAATYKNFIASFKRHQELYDTFLWALPGKKILDLWAGSGLDLRYFSEQGYEVKGVEISQWSIDLYEDTIKELVTQADMREIDTLFDSASFDGVRCIAAIVHMNKERSKEIFEKIHKLLVKGGCLFITTKLRVEGEPEDTVKESNSIPWTYKRFVYRQQPELEKALAQAWFTIQFSTISNYGQQDSWIAVLAGK